MQLAGCRNLWCGEMPRTVDTVSTVVLDSINACILRRDPFVMLCNEFGPCQGTLFDCIVWSLASTN